MMKKAYVKQVKSFINEIGSKGVVVGGHSADLNNAKDFLFTKNETYTFENKRFDTKHTHGTGCTFQQLLQQN